MYLPLNEILPLVAPTDIVISGWDINKLSMDKAMERAQVLEFDL